MSFENILSDETLSLKSADVSIEGNDGKKYKFTVNELPPTEMALCVDEFGEAIILALVYRSVRDQDGKRMSKEQANRLPPEVIGKFVNAYNELIEEKQVKKKSTKKKPSN